MSFDCTTSTFSWNSQRSRGPDLRPGFSSSLHHQSIDTNKAPPSRCFPQNHNHNQDVHDNNNADLTRQETAAVKSTVETHHAVSSRPFRNGNVPGRLHDYEPSPPRTVSQSQFSTISSWLEEEEDLCDRSDDAMSIGSKTCHPSVVHSKKKNFCLHNPTHTDEFAAASLDGESLDSQDWMELVHQGYVVMNDDEEQAVAQEAPSMAQEHTIPTIIEIKHDAPTASTITGKLEEYEDNEGKEEEEMLGWGTVASLEESMEDRWSDHCLHPANHE